MIIVQLIGGLGNQLFQYAFGRSLAIKNNTDLLLDINKFENYKLHNFSLQHFNIIQKFASINDIKKLTSINRLHDYLNNKYLKNAFSINKVKEKGFSFDQKYFTSKKNAYVEGYWQNENYFIDIADTIRNDFRITQDLTGKNFETSVEINNTNSVSLHIRRGDYVSNSKTNQVYGTCTIDYYLRAIEIIASQVSNPTFFIFTDDVKWVIENFTISAAHQYVTQNDASTNYEDLRLMSLCKHHIIANSSFSWWGAWLNNNPKKIVIAPQQWFADPIRNSQADQIVPKGWLKI